MCTELKAHRGRGRLIVMTTNMRGQGCAHLSRLEALVKRVDEGVVDLMCVCETKLKRSHITEVERLKRRYPSVVLRMCQGATEARRGVLTM